MAFSSCVDMDKKSFFEQKIKENEPDQPKEVKPPPGKRDWTPHSAGAHNTEGYCKQTKSDRKWVPKGVYSLFNSHFFTAVVIHCDCPERGDRGERERVCVCVCWGCGIYAMCVFVCRFGTIALDCALCTPVFYTPVLSTYV